MSFVFSATPYPNGELIRLVDGGGAIIAFDDWIATAESRSRAALARLLQAWADNEVSSDGTPLVTPGDDGAKLHPALVASLGEHEARSIGLPPASRLRLDVESEGIPGRTGFRVLTRWARPNGLAVRATLTGARLSYDSKEWRATDPAFSVYHLVERLNAATDEPDREAALAALRLLIGDTDRRLIMPDGFIEKLRLSYAVGFSLALNTDAGNFDFDPVLFGSERRNAAHDGAILDQDDDCLLSPVQQESFARKFRVLDNTRRSYLLNDGTILFLDPSLRQTLEIVRAAQRSDTESRRSFALNPRRHIVEALAGQAYDVEALSALFIETQQFSERILGIDVWRKPVLPWILPKPNSWLPEKFGLRVGDPPDETIVDIPFDQIDEALSAVEQAVREERSTFVFDGTEIPANEQTVDALKGLAELQSAAATVSDAEMQPPLPLAQRYFLEVDQNLEALGYAPLFDNVGRAEFPKAQFALTVTTAPKPHQISGFSWLVDCWRTRLPGALLADDMGLGKTYQALAFLAWIKAERLTDKPALIVAPTGLLANWKAEIDRHLAPGAVGRLVELYGANLGRLRQGARRDIDTGGAGIEATAWSDAGIVLTTYETLRDYHMSFARQPFSVVLYDEAQKLKNPASQLTRAAKTLNARFQLAMTGTPVENRLQDLWSIMDVIHPGLLGASKSFEKTYPSDDQDKLRTLHDLLLVGNERNSPHLLRRMKSDSLKGLPAKTTKCLPVAMPPLQTKAYNEVIQRALSLRNSGQRGHMLEILHRLRGVSLHPANPENVDDFVASDSARITATFETLDAIAAAGEKVLIFCESLAMQALLAVEIKRRYGLQYTVPRIHGGVTGENRQKTVDWFQSRPVGFDVMILSPKAGGVGLTLTAANHVIHVSRWWNPAVEDQATDRVFRIGQTRDVHVYLPQSVHPDPHIGPTSFDLKLDALMTRKRGLSYGLLCPGESENDVASLFDDIVGTAEPDTELNDWKNNVDEASHRPILTIAPNQTPDLHEHAEWPRRVSFSDGGQRDFTIFRRPVAGKDIKTLVIKDPYGCADEAKRRCMVTLVQQFLGTARSIELVKIYSYDAESVNRNNPERSDVPRRDLALKWAAAFGGRCELQHVEVSRRENRKFHDREIVADLSNGDRMIWDPKNSVDAIIGPRGECTVTFTTF